MVIVVDVVMHFTRLVPKLLLLADTRYPDSAQQTRRYFRACPASLASIFAKFTIYDDDSIAFCGPDHCVGGGGTCTPHLFVSARTFNQCM